MSINLIITNSAFPYFVNGKNNNKKTLDFILLVRISIFPLKTISFLVSLTLSLFLKAKYSFIK